MITPALKSLIEEWLKKAGNDLIMAERILEIEPKILDGACFHFQQAIEKFLKAYLTYNGTDFPKTHSITFLLAESANFDPVFATIDPLNINAFSVVGRYPDSALLPTVAEVNHFYQLALNVRDLVKERIIFP